MLGAVHKGDEGAKERVVLQNIARAWKRGGRNFNQPVWFVWVEGDRWSGWLRQAYGIKKSALPGVVVIDPPVRVLTQLGTEAEADIGRTRNTMIRPLKGTRSPSMAIRYSPSSKGFISISCGRSGVRRLWNGDRGARR